MQQFIIPKFYNQSLESYKNRLKSSLSDQELKMLRYSQQDEDDQLFLGRSMAEPIHLIPSTNFVSSLLFPIRYHYPYELQQFHIMKPLQKEYLKKKLQSIASGRIQQINTFQEEKPNKITKYLFGPIHLLTILQDPLLSDEEKIQLAHLRKIIQDDLVLKYSFQKFDNIRILRIINSLESPIGSIPPLSKDQILNVINVLEHLIPVIANIKKKKLQEIQKQNKIYKQNLNKQIQYLPGIGSKFKQAQQDFLQSIKKM